MYVPITKVAEELGVDRSNARRIARRLGFEPTKRQMLCLGHRQRVLCWTRDQVNQMLAERRRQGFEVRA